MRPVWAGLALLAVVSGEPDQLGPAQQNAADCDEVRDIVNMATLCVAEACRGDSYWETLRSTSD